MKPMLDHACKERHPGCLCNRCKNDHPDIECCLWDDYGLCRSCPISECNNFELEEAHT